VRFTIRWSSRRCGGGGSNRLIFKAVFVAVLLSCVVFAAAASASHRAPTGLVVTGVTHNQVALNWNDYTRFSPREYSVRRYNASGSLIDTRMTGSRSSDYVWTGLNPRTTYRFRVAAVASGGHVSQYSSTVTATTQAATNGSTALTWIHPTGDGFTLSGTYLLEANATDPEGIRETEFWKDGTLLGKDSTAPYQFSLDTTIYPNGRTAIGFCATDNTGVRTCMPPPNHGIVGTINNATPPPPTSPPPSGSHSIPVEELALPAANVPGTPHHACSVWDTDHTEVYPTGQTNVDKHGTIRWEPGGHYAANRKTYMLLGHRVLEGGPGRMTAGHNDPADDPYGWTPLTAPPPNGVPNGVSPFALDWFLGRGTRGYEIVIEPENAHTGSGGSGNYHYQLFTDAEAEARRGQWVWLWVEVTWGRKDGSTATPGSLKVWVAGEDTPRINQPNINTHWYGQGMLTFWECTYWIHGNPTRSVIQTAGPRFGRTPQEAYNDNPRFYQVWQGESGMGSWAAKPPVEGNVPIPAGLRW
jgi:Fibronectin type III domain/Bacterial Ig domain